MIKALKEYNEMVWKPGCKWVRKHWKGYMVYCAVCVIGWAVYVYYDEIRMYAGRKVKFIRKKEDKP